MSRQPVRNGKLWICIHRRDLIKATNANNRGDSEPNTQCRYSWSSMPDYKSVKLCTVLNARLWECQTVHIQHSIWKMHVQKTSIPVVVSTRYIPSEMFEDISGRGWRDHLGVRPKNKNNRNVTRHCNLKLNKDKVQHSLKERLQWLTVNWYSV